MNRRVFIGRIAAGILAAPLVADARQGKVWRIGLLSSGSPQEGPSRDFQKQLLQGFHDLGYVESRDFVMEYRWAEGHQDRLPALAANLVRADVDIIVTGGTPATKAAKEATQTIPIVFAVLGSAVEKRIVASLARPGGNVTGLSLQPAGGKLLQVFKEAVPTLSRLVWLHDPASAVPRAEGQMRSYAQAFKVEMQFVALRDLNSVAAAFAEFKRGTNGLLLDWSTPLLLVADQVCRLALQRGLPTVAYVSRRFPEAGCLMSYGENLASVYRRTAVYVDKILKGAKPADLPVEQPTKFELVINLKTAKALGLTIPPSLLLRADEVIQ